MRKTSRRIQVEARLAPRGSGWPHFRIRRPEMRQYFLFTKGAIQEGRRMGSRAGSEKPVVLDFFAGCGGLSLGLELAGFKPIFVNELNADAMQTYVRNRREYPYLERLSVDDIKKLVRNDGAALEDALGLIKKEFKVDYARGSIDLVVGGPPCQDFSGIGHRRSYSVDKQQLPSNHLYEDYAYVIGRIRPKIFLFENVRGLLSAKWTAGGQKGEIWEQVRATLGRIPGYRTSSGGGKGQGLRRSPKPPSRTSRRCARGHFVGCE